MKEEGVTFTDKLIAYLALLSGLSISAVAVYYSVIGLVSIFSAAVIPIIVMGVVLEISKLVGTVWLKLNWDRAPFFIKTYMTTAVVVLMIITSLGIFGFLSKAHSDQSLVSGDVQSKIAVYDEKIKTSKENIEANRKVLKQLDEAVDQVMARSSDEKGADKAVAIRRAQIRDRARLQAEIIVEQKAIVQLNEARAPIAAEVRKVEAEVGPIKYIAAFIYGDNPDTNVLEKAVTWVIIIIVSVFDPLAVVLLLASQYSFQWFRKQRVKVEAETIAIPAHLPNVEYNSNVRMEDAAIPVRYPGTDADLEELATAFNEARKKVHVDDMTAPAELRLMPTTTKPTFNELSEEDIARLEAGKNLEFPPQGTPSEVWSTTVKNEQQAVDNIDKIYKASSEDLAKHMRSSGWFQATFPKKDNN